MLKLACEESIVKVFTVIIYWTINFLKPCGSQKNIAAKVFAVFF